MPLLKGPAKAAQEAAEAPAEPKSLAVAYSMARRGAARSTAPVAEDDEAPAGSIAEAILRKRKAAAPAPEPELDDLDLGAEPGASIADLFDGDDLEEEAPAVTPPRDRIDAIMRRKRALERG